MLGELDYTPICFGEKTLLVMNQDGVCLTVNSQKYDQWTKEELREKINNAMQQICKPEQEKAYFRLPDTKEDETLWEVLELPEKYRDCLYFFYYEDYSVREIARLLGMPENTVKTNLKRGREALKKRLADCDK